MNEYGMDYVRIRLDLEKHVMSTHPITCPEDAVDFLATQMKDLDREVIAVVHLASDGKPVHMTIASIGTLSEASASARELFKAAIISNANAVLIAHNHPSGSLHVSVPDVEMTKRMIECGKILGIPVWDHVIIAGYTGAFLSLKQEHVCEFEQAASALSAAQSKDRYQTR